MTQHTSVNKLMKVQQNSVTHIQLYKYQLTIYEGLNILYGGCKIEDTCAKDQGQKHHQKIPHANEITDIIRLSEFHFMMLLVLCGGGRYCQNKMSSNAFFQTK